MGEPYFAASPLRRVKKETAPREGPFRVDGLGCLCRAGQAPLNSGFLEMRTRMIPATHAAET
jgi:hypothetical protein